jgi:predicted Zn-dependent protease
VVRLHDPKAGSAETAPGVDDVLGTVGRLLREGEIESARLEAESLVSGHPDEPRAHLAAAQVQVAAHRYREAEAAARRALGLDPRLGPAHRLLGDALVAQGRFAEGVAWWERWLGLTRHDPASEGERSRVRAAVEAARTIDLVLRGERG